MAFLTRNRSIRSMAGSWMTSDANGTAETMPTCRLFAPKGQRICGQVAHDLDGRQRLAGHDHPTTIIRRLERTSRGVRVGLGWRKPSILI